MSDAITPTRNRRLLTGFLAVVMALLAVGNLYVKWAVDNPPRWAELATPLLMAVFGMLYLAIPDSARMPRSYRVTIAAIFFLLSGLMLLIIFF